MSKKSLWIFVVLAAALAATVTIAAPPKGGAAGTLSFYTGEVSVFSKGAWRKAALDAPIFQGDSIKTGADSTAEISLSDGSILRMGPGGQHRIDKASFAGKGRVVNVFTSAGRLWVNARSAVGRNAEFKVSTDKAVCAIRGTVFDVNAEAQGVTISVFQGKVETWSAIVARKGAESGKPGKVSAPTPVPGPTPVAPPTPVTEARWVEIVSAMQRISVDAKGGFARSDIPPSVESMDQWVRWNRDRDRAAHPEPGN